MAKRYFNWKLAIVLLLGLVVLGATAVGLRWWQRSRRAEDALPRGREAYKQQRWEEAATYLGRYLAISRGDVGVLLKYADALLNIRPSTPNRVQGAIASYREALRIDKSNAEAAKKLTELYLTIGSPGEAELIITRQLEASEQKDPELRRLLALALAGQRKFAESAGELKNIITDDPNQVSAYETLGRLVEQRPGDFAERSAHWFDEAVKNNPSSALAYIIRAAYRLRSQDRAEALADLEQAEKLGLSDPDVQLRLAIEFINANVLDRAERHLAGVQGVEPTDVALWQTWARLALTSQSETKMAEIAEAGLKELSSYPWDFLPLAAELFIRARQLDRATECISKLRDKDLIPETVAFFEGLIADQKGEPYEAIRALRRSIQLGNRFPQVRLTLSSLLLRVGNAQSALRELRSLVTERPDLLDGRLALVRLLARTGNWAATAEQARRAMDLSPNNLEAALYYWRARIYQLAAQPTAANPQVWQDVDTQLAALEKATDGAADVKLLQLQSAMQQSDFTRAKAVLQELKKDRPSQPRIALAEAQLLVAQDKVDQAISVLKQAAEESGDAVELITYLAALLDRQGDHQGCEEVINDALSRIEQPAAQRDLGLLLAQIYTGWGEPNKAYQLVTTLNAKLPNDIPLKRQFLAFERVVKDPETAQQLINEIKALEGDDGWQWRYEQARLWFAGEDFQARYFEIVSLLQENLLANPDDQSSRTLLAAAYDRAGELRLGISTYREALTRSPDDLRIIIPLVSALRKANEFDEAQAILDRASQRYVFHPGLKALQVESHLRRRELAPASEILEELLKNDPNNRAICLTLAGLKIQQNQFTKAEQLLEGLRAQEPNSLEVGSALVRVKLRQGESQKALQLCDEFINILENAPAYILRARAYAELKQPDKAVADLEHATRIEPNNVAVWTAKSDFHNSVGEPNMAMDCIDHALTLAPDDISLQKRAVTLLLTSADRDRISRGRTLLESALKSSPQDNQLQLLKARLLLGEGTAPAIKNAEQILQQITEQQPAVSEAWVLLAEISLNQGEHAKALDAAMQGLIHRRNDRALLLVKAAAESARAPILAIPTLRTLHELDPNDVDVAVRLARTYMAAGQPQNAVDILEKQLPSCADALEQRRVNTALAVALYKDGNKDQAQQTLDLLVEADPNDPGPLLAQVRLLSDDGIWGELHQKVVEWHEKRPQDLATPLSIAAYLGGIDDTDAKEAAENVLRMALQSNPDSQEALINLAILLYTTGRSQESAQLYQRALQIDPNNVIAINNFAWILCEEQNQPQQALVLVERGLKMAPQYKDLIDTRGMVYYRLGEFEKAAQDFTTCIELYPAGNPAKVASHFHLARALDKLGQTAKAIEQLEKALALQNEIVSQNRVGGLSPADLTEAQRLRQQLEKGG